MNQSTATSSTNEPVNHQPEARQAPRAAMAIVFIVVVVDLLGFGIVLPLLPLTGDEYVKPLIADERAHGPILGLLMAAFSAMQFLFSPAWGRLSDRIGRRPVILVGLVGSVIFYSLFGFAAGLYAPGRSESLAALALVLLFVARIGAGVAGATIATAQAVIADCTSQENRKKGMALIGAAFGIAFTFGPLVGAAAMRFAPTNQDATSWTGYIAAGLSLIALILAIALLPETRQPGRSDGLRRSLFDRSAWRAALSNWALAPVILTFFLATLGFGAFEPTLSFLLTDSVKINKDKIYLVFAYVGFVLMLTQGLLYRRLAKKWSEFAFMNVGIILMAVGLLALGAVSWLAISGVGDYDLSFNALMTLLLIALATAVVGFAFVTPSAQALVSRRTSPEKQGEILGVNQSMASLARILGPIFGVSLYKLTPAHMLPYVFGALLLALMLPLMPRIRKG